MKTIAVIYSGGRRWGGIESYLANLFRLYDRGQMGLLLVSLGEWELTQELSKAGLSADTRVLSGRRLSLGTIRQMRRLMLDEEVQLIVSQGVVANAYARVVAAMTGLPGLSVVHSDLDLDYPRPLTRGVYRISDRSLRRYSQNHIAVSGYLKDQLVQTGVAPDRVRVVYNGVDKAARGAGVSRFAGGEPPGEGGHGDEKSGSRALRGDVSLVSVGRLHAVKNFDSLVRAVALLPHRVTLTVWGEGEQGPALKALTKDLELEGRVRFPGESENMGQALQGADIYLQPSKSEGCSFAVAEAMLCGMPVIVTPRGGLPEQVRDGVTGLVTSDESPEAIAEAVERLLSEDGLAARLATAGKKAAEEMYSMDRWLNETTAALCAAAKDGVGAA